MNFKYNILIKYSGHKSIFQIVFQIIVFWIFWTISFFVWLSCNHFHLNIDMTVTAIIFLLADANWSYIPLHFRRDRKLLRCLSILRLLVWLKLNRIICELLKWEHINCDKLQYNESEWWGFKCLSAVKLNFFSAYITYFIMCGHLIYGIKKDNSYGPNVEY